MEADAPKRKRRWYQFSLRTLMIVVTLLAVPMAYVGQQVKFVHDREAILREPRDGYDLRYWVNVDDSDLPLVRRWLGDHQYMAIWFNGAPPNEVARRYRAAFPEAEIRTASRIWNDGGFMEIPRDPSERRVRRHDGRLMRPRPPRA